MSDNQSPLFANRYRIASSRTPQWDYTRGLYFITICTGERRPWFGYIKHGIMCLSDIGSIVADEWTKTANIRPYVTLDAWVVMPNHFHGIIVIHDRDDGNMGTGGVGLKKAETPRRGVSTTHEHPPATHEHPPTWQSGSLGSIINQFKSACTKRIRASGVPDFAWQPRFHDRVIRSNDDMNHFRRYILNNPAAWSAKHR